MNTQQRKIYVPSKLETNSFTFVCESRTNKTGRVINNIETPIHTFFKSLFFTSVFSQLAIIHKDKVAIIKDYIHSRTNGKPVKAFRIVITGYQGIAFSCDFGNDSDYQYGSNGQAPKCMDQLFTIDPSPVSAAAFNALQAIIVEFATSYQAAVCSPEHYPTMVEIGKFAVTYGITALYEMAMFVFFLLPPQAYVPSFILANVYSKQLDFAFEMHNLSIMAKVAPKSRRFTRKRQELVNDRKTLTFPQPRLPVDRLPISYGFQSFNNGIGIEDRNVNVSIYGTPPYVRAANFTLPSLMPTEDGYDSDSKSVKHQQ